MSASHRLFFPHLRLVTCLAGWLVVSSGVSPGVPSVVLVAHSQKVQAPPPVAPKVPQVTGLHGDHIRDDYFWMRQKKDPRVMAYLRAENAHTDSAMKPYKRLEERLYQEMVGRIKQTDMGVPYKKGKFLYYHRTEHGKEHKIYSRKLGNLDAKEEILLDLNQMAKGHSYLALGAFEPSPDENYLAYTVDQTGFRDYTLFVKDLRTGKIVPGSPKHVETVAFAADSKTLFYSVEDQAKRPYRIYRHTLFTDVANDVLIQEEKDERFRVSTYLSRSGEYLFFASDSALTSEVHVLSAQSPTATPTLIKKREQGHEYHVDHGGDFFYIRTNGGGRSNFRVVSAKTKTPEVWTELIPHRPEVYLEGIDVFANHLVLYQREEGLPQIAVYPRGEKGLGPLHRIAQSEASYTLAPGDNEVFDTKVLRFTYESSVTPTSVFDYDMESKNTVLRKRQEVLGGYDPSQYVTERLLVAASDGQKIPVSVVFKKGLPLDGTAPLWMEGYGAYGAPFDVEFSHARLSLLQRGIRYAIAHIRGGGEMGKRWHEGGRVLTKRNTFTDFIEVAEELIRKGYTSKDRLVVEGGSAGGLLMGTISNMRPDLFAVVLAKVPFVDVLNTMADPTVPLTVTEFEEWGNPQIQEHYAYMKSYCPYTNIKRQNYPLMLVRTSFYDSEVMYWEPAKWVAKMRAHKTDSNPLLFQINFRGGHSGSSGRFEKLREEAFDLAFVLGVGLGHLGLH